MLKITPPDYKFCPFCGKSLGLRIVEGDNFKYCQECKWTYYPFVAASASGVAIKNGQVLLVRRAKEPYKDTWMIPAGFIGFGEHPSEAVVREMAEETGLTARVIRLLDVLQADDDPRSMGNFGFYYEVEVEGKIKPRDKKENSAIGWFDLKKLPPIGWHRNRKILQQLGGVF